MNIKNSKYIPKFYFYDIFSIPYNYFFNKGIRGLFFDLDNTLVACNKNFLDDKTFNFLKKISQKFKIIIISNATKKRLLRILENNFCFIYLNLFCKKPSLYGLKKALEMTNLSNNEVIMIGDQLRTDILSSNILNVCSILVNPIDRSKENFFTKFNRFFIEKPFLKKMRKKNFILYQKKFQKFEYN